jgi:coenzyme F420-reducing hydrogenase delta subunit
MRALETGADGVLIAGCLEGGCHFIEGNLIAKRRVNAMRDMLVEIGFEKERLRMVNVSAAMGKPLAEIIIDMVDSIKKLGPSPLRKVESSEFKVQS